MTSLFEEGEESHSSSSSSSAMGEEEEGEQQQEDSRVSVSMWGGAASSSLGGMKGTPEQQREKAIPSDCRSAASSESFSSSPVPSSHPSKSLSFSSASCKSHEGENRGGRNPAGVSRTSRAGEEGTSSLSSSSSHFSAHNTGSACAYTLEDRHMIWRKNAALHYSCVLSHRLEWPSMTVEFLTPPLSSSFSLPFRDGGGHGGRCYRSGVSSGSSSSSSSSSSACASAALAGGDMYVSHRLILGTCTNGEEKNYLTIVELKWPSPSLEEDPLKCETYSGFIPPRARAKSFMQYSSSSSSSSSSSTSLASGGVGGSGGLMVSSTSLAASSFFFPQSVPCVETKARILHPGDLIRAKHMPYNAFSIVTLNEEGLAMYWNFSRHSSFPSADQVISKPQILLVPQECSSSSFSSSSSSSCFCPSLPSFSKTQAIVWDRRPTAGDSSSVSSSFSSLHTLIFSCTDTGMINVYDLNKNSNLQCQANKTTGDTSSSFSSSLHRLKTKTYGGGVTIAEGTMELYPMVSLGIHLEDKRQMTNASLFSLNDIQIHPRFTSVLATAGEDGALRLFDIRQPVQAYSVKQKKQINHSKKDAPLPSSSSTAPRSCEGGASHSEMNGTRETSPSSSSSSSVSSCERKTRSPGRRKERVYGGKFASIFPCLREKENLQGETKNDQRSDASRSLSPSSSVSALNCLSFNGYNENIVGVGTAEGVVSLWDLRYTSHTLLDLYHHTAEITSLHFSPSSSSLLASSSTDGDVAIWDFSRPSQQSKVCILRSSSPSPCVSHHEKEGSIMASSLAKTDQQLGRERREGDKSSQDVEMYSDTYERRQTEEEERDENLNMGNMNIPPYSQNGLGQRSCQDPYTSHNGHLSSSSSFSSSSSSPESFRNRHSSRRLSFNEEINSKRNSPHLLEGDQERRTRIARRRRLFFLHAGHSGGVSDFAWCGEPATSLGFLASGGGGLGGSLSGIMPSSSSFLSSSSSCSSSFSSSAGKRSEVMERGRIGMFLGASVGWDNRLQFWQPSEHLFIDHQGQDSEPFESH
ncbi:wd g-beta repeat-containing protein [Cystoisospora suis]|uniref:Wd g-beta repeat-containing protein n=1 Tax=Cystoisospora suis TaxID=483139 RepID=A0A2C6KRV7_9APIC|nr:wd g-beta repeat-containing protein [Cystoisospora suis]